MTKEEAARILDPETSRDALWKYENEEERLEAVNEACRVACDALRHQENTLRNDPMTLSELREMDGEPVWVKLIAIDRPPAWFLFNLRDNEAINKRGGFVSLIDYGKTWTAYRRKPEEA